MKYAYSLIAVTILCAVMFCLTGCGTIFPQINPPKPPETIYSYDQTMTKNPTAVVVGDKIAVVENQTQTVSVNLTKREKTLSWWQRFTNWLGNLGFIAVIALIAGLVGAPAATMAFLFKRYSAFRKALKQTVVAIEESKAVENNTVKAALSSKQDTDTKKLVDDLRRE